MKRTNSEHTIVELLPTLELGAGWVVCSCGERFHYFGSYECNRWMETHGRNRDKLPLTGSQTEDDPIWP